MRRVRELAGEKTAPKGRNEEEIAGYRDALALIHESHDYISVTPNSILQLHEIMYKHTASSIGGHFKVSDNAIVEVLSDGSRVERFRPIPAISMPDAMERLCSAYRDSIAVGCTIHCFLLACSPSTLRASIPLMMETGE